MLEQVHDKLFSRQYGFLRPYVKHVIYRYLDCGILHNGFARVRCGECGHEYLLAFSCKRRHFCPSCHQKRVVEFGEWLCEEILKAVPHRHFVFSIPKILRRYFLYDRKLQKILKHLGLWPVESLKVEREKSARPPPKTRAFPTRTDTLIDDSYSQLPVSDNLSRASRSTLRLSTGRSNEWLYVDPEPAT